MNPLNRLSEYLGVIERRLRWLALSRGAAVTAAAAASTGTAACQGPSGMPPQRMWS